MKTFTILYLTWNETSVSSLLIVLLSGVTFSFNNPGSTITEGENATASILTTLNSISNLTLERPLVIEFDISKE